MRGGEGCLQRDDAPGALDVLLGLAAVDEGEHQGDVPRIGTQDRRVLLVAVVGLIRQAQTGLGEVCQIARGVLGVGVDVHADSAADAGALHPPDRRRQCVGIRGIVDLFQFGQQRRYTPSFDGVAVEKAGVQIPDALLIGARRRVQRGGLGDDLVNLLLRAVVQCAERAVGGPVGRDVVPGQPTTVDVAEQVVLGAHVRIDVSEVDARPPAGLFNVCRHPTMLTTATAPHRRPVACPACPSNLPDPDHRGLSRRSVSSRPHWA